jgi:catechol 2,3-dioxygenase-like lactoylglutathione lyase family enzyme
MATQLCFNRILVFAPDLERARQFYTQALGLHLLHDDDQVLTFKAPGFTMSVFSCSDDTAPEHYSERPGHRWLSRFLRSRLQCLISEQRE